jgi:pilus assembly protein TadC
MRTQNTRTPIELYQYYMRQAELEIPPMVWIVASFIAALAAGLLLFFLSVLLKLNEPLLGALGFFIVLDIMIGYPYLKGRGRIESIEANLPDALKQMADTLKAGSTYEYALREVAASQYGPLTEEMKKVLRKLEEGENFENAMLSMSNAVESRLVKRVITIILDSIRAGAALADILDEIALDVRELNRIGQERKAKTMMQAIFMVAAGIIVAPFIFGLISTVIDLLISTATKTGSLEGIQLTVILNSKDLIIFSVKSYLLVLGIATAVMMGIMRDGKLSKSLLYMPFLVLLAYIVYFLSRFVTGLLVGSPL